MDLDFIFHFISIVEIIKQGDNLRRISASKRVNDQSKVKKKYIFQIPAFWTIALTSTTSKTHS